MKSSLLLITLLAGGHCATDSTILIRQPRYWEFYQTRDDRRNGPRLEQCIDLIEGRYGHRSIDLSSIDKNATIFIRYNPLRPSAIQPNIIYGFYSQALGFYNYDFDCIDEACSGFYLAVEIPDSNGVDGVLREQWLPFEEHQYTYEKCIGSERFDSMLVNEFVFQIKFDTEEKLSDTIGISSIGFECAPSQSLLQEVLIGSEYRKGGKYQIPSYALTADEATNHLVIYADENNKVRIGSAGFHAVEGPLKKARDLLLISAGTGQRFSDFSRLKQEQSYKTRLHRLPIPPQSLFAKLSVTP